MEDLGDAAAVVGVLRIRVVALLGGDFGEEVAVAAAVAAVIAAAAADGDDDSNLQEGHAVL